MPSLLGTGDGAQDFMHAREALYQLSFKGSPLDLILTS